MAKAMQADRFPGLDVDFDFELYRHEDYGSPPQLSAPNDMPAQPQSPLPVHGFGNSDNGSQVASSRNLDAALVINIRPTSKRPSVHGSTNTNTNNFDANVNVPDLVSTSQSPPGSLRIQIDNPLTWVSAADALETVAGQIRQGLGLGLGLGLGPGRRRREQAGRRAFSPPSAWESDHETGASSGNNDPWAHTSQSRPVPVVGHPTAGSSSSRSNEDAPSLASKAREVFPSPPISAEPKPIAKFVPFPRPAHAPRQHAAVDDHYTNDNKASGYINIGLCPTSLPLEKKTTATTRSHNARTQYPRSHQPAVTDLTNTRSPPAAVVAQPNDDNSDDDYDNDCNVFLPAGRQKVQVPIPTREKQPLSSPAGHHPRRGIASKMIAVNAAVNQTTSTTATATATATWDAAEAAGLGPSRNHPCRRAPSFFSSQAPDDDYDYDDDDSNDNYSNNNSIQMGKSRDKGKRADFVGSELRSSPAANLSAIRIQPHHQPQPPSRHHRHQDEPVHGQGAKGATTGASRWPSGSQSGYPVGQSPLWAEDGEVVSGRNKGGSANSSSSLSGQSLGLHMGGRDVLSPSIKSSHKTTADVTFVEKAGHFVPNSLSQQQAPSFFGPDFMLGHDSGSRGQWQAQAQARAQHGEDCHGHNRGTRRDHGSSSGASPPPSTVDSAVRISALDKMMQQWRLGLRE